jgi:CHAD domain-containing protein
MFSHNLSATEKTILEKIARDSDEQLAKRATIILISNEAATLNEIARLVDASPTTVRRWQKKFAEIRLGIFPDETITENSPAPPPANQVETVTTEAASPTMLIGLQPTLSLAEAGRRVLGYHFRNAMQHEAGTRSGHNIEALHDMRVATRRMRAAIRIFGHGFTPKTLKFLKSGLKETAQALGWVRDWDVFIEKFTAYQQELPANEQSGLAPLLEYCHIQRDLARAKMLAHLDGKDYEKFKAKMTIFIETEGLGVNPMPVDKPVPYQIRHVAPSLIYSRYEAVRAYESFLAHASVELLHQLRINFKHFRYALENFQEILGNEGAMVIAEIKQMQDYLGNLNDAQVACQFLDNFLNHWKNYRAGLTTAKAKKPTAVMKYLKVKLAERELLLSTFPEVWHQFNSSQLPYHLAMAIAAL